jgi:hypothetical protein
MLNSPTPDGKKNLPITALDDFRHDGQVIYGKPDQTKFLFFDTPTIPNKDIYNTRILNHFMCKEVLS